MAAISHYCFYYWIQVLDRHIYDTPPDIQIPQMTVWVLSFVSVAPPKRDHLDFLLRGEALSVGMLGFVASHHYRRDRLLNLTPSRFGCSLSSVSLSSSEECDPQKGRRPLT